VTAEPLVTRDHKPTNRSKDDHTMTSTLTTLPRVAVTNYLRLLRVPVDAAGSLTKHDETWPPALAFDAFEAQVLRLLGSVLRDDELVQDARRQQLRVDQLRRAERLEAEAETRRREADTELEERRDQAKEKAEQAQERKEQEKERVAKQTQQAERKARQEAQAKDQKAKQAAEAREARLETRQRDAEAKRLAAERTALEERREALEVAGSALDVDKAADAVKERRMARS